MCLGPLSPGHCKAARLSHSAPARLSDRCLALLAASFHTQHIVFFSQVSSYSTLTNGSLTPLSDPHPLFLLLPNDNWKGGDENPASLLPRGAWSSGKGSACLGLSAHRKLGREQVLTNPPKDFRKEGPLALEASHL